MFFLGLENTRPFWPQDLYLPLPQLGNLNSNVTSSPQPPFGKQFPASITFHHITLFAFLHGTLPLLDIFSFYAKARTVSATILMAPGTTAIQMTMGANCRPPPAAHGCHTLVQERSSAR